MTELEYSIEVLCTGYSLEELKRQRCELCESVSQNGFDLIDDVSIEVLNKAISCYNKEKYAHIRDEMQRNRVKYGLI